VPAWSRDGTRIAYIALGTLFVVRAVDGAVLMEPNIDVTYGDPVWLR